jgi:hypothetical protein
MKRLGRRPLVIENRAGRAMPLSAETTFRGSALPPSILSASPVDRRDDDLIKGVGRWPSSSR